MNNALGAAFTMKEAACGMLLRLFRGPAFPVIREFPERESDMTQILISDDPDANTGCVLFLKTQYSD